MALRVLMFGWEFPPFNSGGLGTACAGIAKALVEEGTQLTFVLPREVAVSSPGVRFLFARVPLIEIPNPYLSEGMFREMYGGSLIDHVRLYALRAREMVVQMPNDFDIIHAHDWLSFGAGIEAKRISGKPLVVHVHATEFDRSGGAGVNQTVYELERQGMELADMVVTVSVLTKEMVVQKYGIDPAKVQVVHNGVDAPPVASSELKDRSTELDLRALKRGGRKMVLFLGRITLQKGPDWFLKAARRVVDAYPNVLFVIVGSGDMEHQIIREAVVQGIAEKVLFAGFLRGQELTALYRAADIYVLPSVSEPFGIAPLESLVLGTPVLVSNQSGVSEVLRHALKADFWDTDDMADKIVSVLQHKALHQTLRINGEREARGVTWKKAADTLVQLYQKILSFIKTIPKV